MTVRVRHALRTAAHPQGARRRCARIGRTRPVRGARVRCGLPAAGLLAATLAGCASLLHPSGHAHAERYLFEEAGYLGDATLMPDWADTLRRQQAQEAALEACISRHSGGDAAADAAACPRHYRGVAHLLVRAAELPRDRQIHLVNAYVNRKRYREDRTTRLTVGQADEPLRYRSRWATVGEFLQRGGDCEDYATTKYFLLRRLGMAAGALRVVVAWDRSVNDHHAVLAVQREDGTVWLLESDDRIRTAGLHDYQVIYAFNEHSVWDHEAPSPHSSRPSTPTKESPS